MFKFLLLLTLGIFEMQDHHVQWCGVEQKQALQLCGIHHRLWIVVPFLTVSLAQSQNTLRYLSALALVEQQTSLLWNHSLITVAAFLLTPLKIAGLNHVIQSRRLKVVRKIVAHLIRKLLKCHHFSF